MSSSNPPIPVNVGDVLLGKYVVEKVIGAGGMGVVVAVRHRDLGELYAMKFMLPAALANDQAVDRFVREARAAAKLKSEHVAKVHDVGRLENGSPYMVMEYLTGQDLEAVLAQHGPLPVAVAATYVAQACDAIAEAHDANIVHRDLKPANLFLTKRPNGSPCIKVLDFGISKSINPDEAANSMTRTTAIMGSPYYMSPEQMRSSKNVDHRTDIWALGVILYQLSTGRVPFPGETITEVCSGVLADEPMSLVNLLPGIPQEFDGIVRRCLQKQPNYRFPNARELASGLHPIAGNHPGTSGLNLQVAGSLPVKPGTMAMDGPPAHLLSQSGNNLGRQSAPNLAQSGGNLGAGSGHQGGPGQTQAQWGSTQPAQKKGGMAIPIVLGLLAVGGIAAGALFMMNKGDTKSTANAATATQQADEKPATTSTTTATATATATTTTAAAAPTETAKTAEPTASSVASETATSSAPVTSQKVAATTPKTAPRPPRTTTGPIKPPPTTTRPSIY